eukprot:scaffold55331_cov23-Tisochrysis_lutea.AAC.1
MRMPTRRESGLEGLHWLCLRGTSWVGAETGDWAEHWPGACPCRPSPTGARVALSSPTAPLPCASPPNPCGSCQAQPHPAPTGLLALPFAAARCGWGWPSRSAPIRSSPSRSTRKSWRTSATRSRMASRRGR